jgi:anti-sigma regulatory factor (Ser/Thr protein kinase)
MSTLCSQFSHEALLYGSQAQFVDGTLSFIVSGLDADAAIMVAVSARKIELLRDGLGDRTGDVQFVDMAEIGANPARIIPAWRDFADAHAGRTLRGIGEPIWAERSDAELVECQLHESLLNLAFADTGDFRLLCPYDTRALGDAVIAEAHRSHPLMNVGGVECPSEACRPIETVAAPFLEQPLPEPAVGTEEIEFGAGNLEEMRHWLADRAARAGFTYAAAEDILLAVNELATNSVRHGGGRGVLRVWPEGNAIVCEVRDSGPPIEDPLAGRERPVPGPLGGLGLWIVNQVCDLVQIRSLAAGNVVRVRLSLRSSAACRRRRA